jgi:hypothetical protein
LAPFFFQFWLILHLLDPDTDPHSECGSGSETLPLSEEKFHVNST